jgi:hypothetical protein
MSEARPDRLEDIDAKTIGRCSRSSWQRLALVQFMLGDLFHTTGNCYIRHIHSLS